MKIKISILILILSALVTQAKGQQPTYTVEKAPFSSDIYDEYAPVYFNNGIVFTSNRGAGSFVDYSSSAGKATFNICFIDTTKKVSWSKSKLFSKNLETPFNDGPVTFNSRRDTIYFSRNLLVTGNFSDLSSPRNKLGIFTSVWNGKKWTTIREFRFNNEWYNVTTPFLTPDGTRLYFASDKPGGFGGSDIYYCEWKTDYWTDPLNMGPVINTRGNESYPYVNPSGEFLFASDGHPGMGGKDIFLSHQEDGKWQQPVSLDPPVNSTFDDFGIITDSYIGEGYFSSNREKTLDIYKFRTNIPQIFYTQIQKENQYCFSFRDSGSIAVDTTYLKFVWDFGDGYISEGETARHCYRGAGTRTVKLDVIDRESDALFFTKLIYDLKLSDYKQPYISSADFASPGETIEFSGSGEAFPGYTAVEYSWDFGDGQKTQGQKVKFSYAEPGVHIVRLGLLLKSDSTGKFEKKGVAKKITIIDPATGTSGTGTRAPQSIVFPDIRSYENASIKIKYSAEERLNNNAVFAIEVQTSPSPINPGNNIFSKIPPKYSIREIQDTEKGNYIYITNPQLSLMASYRAFKEIRALGYNSAKIRLFVPADQAERDIYVLMRVFGDMSDSYLDQYERLTSNAYIMLDQLVKILNKYPSLRLEIAFHSDNSLPMDKALTLTNNRAQKVVNYLVSRGVEQDRLLPNGYGSQKQVNYNRTPQEKARNRRLEISVLK
jgi:hypothetical protein